MLTVTGVNQMVKYPTGSLTQYSSDQTKLLKLKKTHHKKNIIFSDRGMSLEQQINESNKFYLSQNLAVIHKKPTPIQIVKVDYPKRSRAVIKEAYFRQASTTDYNGVYKGKYLDFEAKETRNTTSFPLKNFHEHQIIHLQQCLDQQGICFTIIRFVTLNKYFITPATFIIKAWNNSSKKSLTLKELELNSYEIKSGFRPTLPYLDVVDKFILDGKK